MPLAKTAPLREEIERVIPSRPFEVEFWDGTRLPSTEGDAPDSASLQTSGKGGPTFRVQSPKAVAQALMAPGQLGLGRAYATGTLEVSDLDDVMRLLDTWEPPPIETPDKLRLAAAAVRAAGLTLPPRPPAAELRPRGRRHTPERDRRAVRHHYDVSNDFFALFLDESMTYSCALFRDGSATLEEAQRAKLELICSKLALQAGQRLLDIGCGWGALAIHAARHHGASVIGITLSERQADLARSRASEQGLEDRVDIRVRDYRDLGPERFHAIASIGMVEHVGEEQIDEYAATVARVLEPGGRVLNHGIAALGPGNDVPFEFTDHFVFPDGQLLHLPRVLSALEGAGLETLHVEGLHRHYEQTLAHWARRLDERLEDAVRLAGPERVRVWRLYLRAARENFRAGFASVYQVLCTGGRRSAQPDPYSQPARLRRSHSATQASTISTITAG